MNTINDISIPFGRMIVICLKAFCALAVAALIVTVVVVLPIMFIGALA